MPYNLKDTIAAITTPRGVGAIGMVRVSGPAAVAVVDKFFSPSNKIPLSQTHTHLIVHGWITDNGSPVDEVMVSLMLKPNSYTGDDTVEVAAHAAPLILERILKLATANGARLAGPGEFTFRAFMNGKIDLAKAEAVADVISSSSALALEAALSHLDGSFSSKIHLICRELLNLLSSLEAALDHPEEGIEFVSQSEALEILNSLIGRFTEMIDTSRKMVPLKEGLKTVIIGRPNAGKSSLFNAILEKERAIVTNVPGTTRDTIEETVIIQGFPIVLRDTAGIGTAAHDQVENIGQNRTVESIRASRIVIWVLDSSIKDTEADQKIAETLKTFAAGKVLILVWNKADLPFKAEEEKLLGFVRSDMVSGVIKVSAKKGLGLSELETAIVSSFVFSAIPDMASANLRHIEIFSRTLTSLKDAVSSIRKGLGEEITANHLRDAMSYLGEITGKTVSDEVLENIFKNFCVGK